MKIKKAYAVIGANYGDEGKGLITDYLAGLDPENTLVIRSNGGAQAGHTVVEPEYTRRHVFGHFGAGTFAGAPSYLTRNFIVNPVLFKKEWNELKGLGAKPDITIHGEAPVTTPVDMLFNQLIETHRAGRRHGSCGIGINETVTRSLRTEELNLCVEDLLYKDRLEEKLNLIGRDWIKTRLKELGLSTASEPVKNCPEYEILTSPELLKALNETFKEAVLFMLSRSGIENQPPPALTYIYEGAQGLLLNMDRSDLFPHVTRSRTGVAVPAVMAEQAGFTKLEIIYVSRSYLTRHGAGPLPGETAWSLPDKTNLENPFQGKLRFAPLDLNLLRDSIERDLLSASASKIELEPSLAFTCLDQLPLNPGAQYPLPIAYTSFGPTRADILRNDSYRLDPRVVEDLFCVAQ